MLHNQSALRLKSRLLYQPGVMVTSVPYQLASSGNRAAAEAAAARVDLVPGVADAAGPAAAKTTDDQTGVASAGRG